MSKPMTERQPEPCPTCGGERVVHKMAYNCGHELCESEHITAPCPDCQPDQPQDREPWRKQTSDEFRQYYKSVIKMLPERWQLGIDSYHADVEGFQGLPEDQLPEELMDALFYSWYNKRRIKHLEDLLQRAFKILMNPFEPTCNPEELAMEIEATGIIDQEATP